ncbi:MAG TPA: sugar ABC transporter permease [Kosmotogaceae bacterium]|nr:MAG: Binding-protein-dependent transport systems inner membrane component [Thermotogales bacterium 46_20]HAA86233.1 sugar ABC transporter permease [Kosmotogaceae bacterium]
MRTRLVWILLFLGPALAALLIFLVIPIFASFVLSVTDFDVYALADWSRARFVGLSNFQELLSDPLFWRSLLNTLYCLIVAMPLTVAISLGVAMLINREKTRFKGLFRVIYFLPFVTNTVAIAVVWSWILNMHYGLLNWFLGLFGISGPNWLGDPTFAMSSIIMLVVWKAIGYNMILFISGLQNIPDFLYEAAELDGASGWQKFVHITIPMLRPTMLFVTTMMLIGYLQLFEEPYMLTDGGPLNSTLSVVLYLYRQGFRFFELGYASALAVALFLIIITITLIRMRLSKQVS